jgi:glycosyltransferase involved in cell wall biosynthesis
MKISKIKINSKYCLEPTTEVRKDNINPIFNDGSGLYICNYPDAIWYAHHQFEQKGNKSIEKKNNFFELMSSDSILLSPTQDENHDKPTKTIKNGNVIHFGSRFTGRLAQISQAFKMIVYLFKNKNKFNYCLVYNFYPSEMFFAFVAKFLFNKKIIVDFEDDYLLQSNRFYYKFYFNLVKKIPYKIICINVAMKKYFAEDKVFVFNGFIDLSYTKDVDYNFFSGCKFLYSGSFDTIRGIDLIPEIIVSLRRIIDDFSIYITGSGPLENEILNWEYPEIKYFGYLNEKDFNNIISEVDFCLVLQKPDHPFSLGSFPSKIEYYSKFKKPIYSLNKI